MQAFHQPFCPATSTAALPTLTMQQPLPQIPLSEPVTRHPRNDALIYLLVTGVVFLAFPIFAWNKDRRSRSKDERTRKRAVVQSIIAKQAAIQATTSALPATKARSPAVGMQTRPELLLTMAESVYKSSSAVESRKNSKSRSSSARAPISRSSSSKGKALTVPRQPPVTTDLIDLVSSPSPKNSVLSTTIASRKQVPEMLGAINVGPVSLSVEVSNSPVAPHDSKSLFLSDNIHSKVVLSPRNSERDVLLAMVNDTPKRSDETSAATMTSISSPISHNIVSSGIPSTPGSPSLSESSFDAALKSSTSSATAPLTPASIPAILHASSRQDTEKWDGADLPSSDPAWDWDGQHSTYSSPERGRSSKPATPSPSHMCQVPSLPSLVFPTLNDDPPPAASPASQIAMLKTALESSRENEKAIRREAERFSKECELMKWRWTTAITEWQRRETHLQTQINSLIMQVQALSMQAPHFSSLSHHPLPMQYYSHSTPPFPPPYATYPHTQQSMPSLHSSPIPPPSSDLSDVNEELAEAILRRPESIRTSVSRGRRRNDTRSLSQTRIHKEVTALTSLSHQSSPIAQTNQIEEFEFPTLLDRGVTPLLDSLPTLNTAGDDG